jgi:hypothetical protein
MRALSASDLLDAWELGVAQGPVQRAVTLLAAACPDSGEDELAALELGRRDRALLMLREILFGPDLAVLAACPACGAPLEARCRVSDLAGLASSPPSGTRHEARVDGYHVAFRLPASRDMASLTTNDTTAVLRDRLLALCVLEARDDTGAPMSVDTLPSSVVAGVVGEMAAADPAADVQLDLTCAACAHRWPAVFDIATVLWKEVHAWAQRTLRDVHSLAQAYGWREADVLALTPTRRHAYLELCRT